MGNLRVASSKSRDDYPVPLVYTVKGHLLVIVLYNIIDLCSVYRISNPVPFFYSVLWMDLTGLGRGLSCLIR